MVPEVGPISPLTLIQANDASWVTLGLVFESLVVTGARAEFLPRLAREWSVSDDETEWTFHLHQNVKWHDGHPFTSADVKFTYETFYHPEYQGNERHQMPDLRGEEDYRNSLAAIDQRVKDEELGAHEAAELKRAAYQEWLESEPMAAPDDYTIVFRLAVPAANFISNMCFSIAPEHILSGVTGDDLLEHPFNENPVGTGAFRLERYASDQVHVIRNDAYWGKIPHLERITIKTVPDEAAVRQALESGAGDVAYVALEEYEAVARMDHIRTFEAPRFVYNYIGFDLTNPLLEDKTVRHALAHAVNKEEMVMSIYRGLALPAHTHGSPVRWDYNPSVRTFPYDLGRARELLDEAGWSLGEDGIRSKEGQPFTFSLVYNPGLAVNVSIAESIKESLGNIGVDVRLEEDESVIQRIFAGDFETFLAGWQLGPDPDASTIWRSDGGFNFTGFTSARADDIMDEAIRISDLERRAELYGELQAILAEEQPYIFLFFPMIMHAVHERIEVDGSFMVSPTRGVAWNIEDWWIPQQHQ